MKETLILIPPSEGKAEGGTEKPIQLTEDQEHLLNELDHCKPHDMEKILGVKDKALQKALEANASVRTAKTLPAIERYTGVVFQGLNYPTLSNEAKKFCNKHVRIMSALFGLISPQENIPNYKFKIGTLGATKFWHSRNNLENYFVIDFLPKSHQKAVRYTEGIRIEFFMERFGAKVPAGHNGKLIKGKFIRYLCEQGKLDIQTLKGFSEDGYVWMGKYYLKKA